MPVTIRRALATQSDHSAEPRGQQSARSDRPGLKTLDAISVSPVPDGPFGQGLRYGAADGRVNALIHELPVMIGESIHELSTMVDGRWITQPAGLHRKSALVGPQPPIANISTRGRCEVAAVRSSE